ncbi:unnamed protein product [Mucor hiemalis]
MVIGLLYVCQYFNYVDQKQTINLPLEINADFAFRKFSSCSTMAKVVHFICDISIEEAVFNKLVNYFTNCLVVGVNFNDLRDLTSVKKICATMLKRGIKVNVFDSNPEAADIVRMLTEKYREKHRAYQTGYNSSDTPKRKRKIAV